MKKCLALALAVTISFSSWSQIGEGGEKLGKAQIRNDKCGESPRSGRGGMGLKSLFFPPDLIMRSQDQLALSDEQRNEIKELMKKTASDFTELQWKESEEQEKMESLLKDEKIDEAKTLEQFEKLLQIENQIKKLHIGTMIRTLNCLSPDQRAKLDELKKQSSPRHGDDPRRGGQEAPPPPCPPE